MSMLCWVESARAKLTYSETWGADYVNLRMAFHRFHGHKLILGTDLGVDFFDTLHDCLLGANYSGKGEYAENFKKLVNIGRMETV